jgi:hypothetical protein
VLFSVFLTRIADGYSNFIKAPYKFGVKLSRLVIGKGSALETHTPIFDKAIESL